MARREGGEWLSSPTYSVATGVSASTLLLVLYEHVTYGGSSTRITGAYGPCDAEGYGVSALVSSWRNRVSSLKGFNRQRQDRLHHHVPAVTCKPLALNLAVQGMPMVRRITTVVAVALVTALSLGAPARADHSTDHTIAQMTAHYQDPALEPQNRPFALLYLRTTEGMRDANNDGEFSDPEFWDTEVIPTFADYYLDAYAAWTRGDTQAVDVAWRIAFRTEPERLNCTQMLYLGINAHVNNDLAFMIEEMGSRYTYPDHKHVDDVLAFRTRPVVYPEIQRELCPGLFSEVVPPGADLDIFAWRQLAWDNAQRLLAAPTPQAREAIAKEVRQHAQDKAREILRWYR